MEKEVGADPRPTAEGLNGNPSYLGYIQFMTAGGAEEAMWLYGFMSTLPELPWQLPSSEQYQWLRKEVRRAHETPPAERKITPPPVSHVELCHASFQHWTGALQKLQGAAKAVPKAQAKLKALTTQEMFADVPDDLEYFSWPFAAKGLVTITDGLPKLGKTDLGLRGYLAGWNDEPYLGHATKAANVLYITEQSKAVMALQAREIGITEAHDKIRWICREQWVLFSFEELIQFIIAEYAEWADMVVFDTWHTIARMEDPKQQGESIKLMNLTCTLTVYDLGVELKRHERKSGGDVGESGINSIAVSGAVDTVIQLRRLPGNKRRLTVAGRLLNTTLTVDRVDGKYINLGDAEPQPTEGQTVDLLPSIPLHESDAMTEAQIFKHANVKRAGNYQRQLKYLVEKEKKVAKKIITTRKKVGVDKATVYWRTEKGGGQPDQLNLSGSV